MSILNRYVLNELFKIFSLSVGFLTMLLFLDRILYLTELIINRGVSLVEVAKIMMFIAPAFLSMTIPISVLVASVVVFNQLSADSEWVAMKANGLSFLTMMRPVLYFALTTYMMTNAIIFYALPWGNQSFKQIIYDIIRNRANFEIKPNVFNTDFDNLVLMVREKEGTSILKNVFIADSTSSQNPKIIVAEEGAIVANSILYKIQLQLKNGTIHDLSEQRKNYQLLNFDRYDLNLNLPNSEHAQQRASMGNRELSVDKLKERIAQLRREGKTTYTEEVEMSKKFSIPFTCLIFGFIGAPLGIKSSRSGKSGSFTIATTVIVLYYISLIFTQNLGSIGKINPLMSVWIPNVIFTTVMVYLVYKMQKELPFKLSSWVQDIFVSIFQASKAFLIKIMDDQQSKTAKNHKTK